MNFKDMKIGDSVLIKASNEIETELNWHKKKKEQYTPEYKEYRQKKSASTALGYNLYNYHAYMFDFYHDVTDLEFAKGAKLAHTITMASKDLNEANEFLKKAKSTPGWNEGDIASDYNAYIF